MPNYQNRQQGHNTQRASPVVSSARPGLYASYTLVPLSDWHWPHFHPRELACRCAGRHCAGRYWHDPLFLNSLEQMRALMGGPLRILSGHRCPLHNARVGGAPRSQHKRIAADIALRPGAGPPYERRRLREAAEQSGFTGLGFYQTFLHVDQGPARHWFGPNVEQNQWLIS